MRKILKENRKEIIKILFVIISLSTVSIYVSNWLKTDVMQDRIERSGIWGPLILISYTVASHVFAPVAGTPGVVVSFAAYGLYGGWIILYIASLVSATINFYISKKLGRTWVIKLAGKNSLEKIDKFVEIMGTKLLIIARLFGFPMFEFISYAAGFTNMSFRKYILITAIFIILPGYLFSILIMRSLSTVFGLTLFFIAMFVVGGLFSWYSAQKYLKFKDSKKPKVGN